MQALTYGEGLEGILPLPALHKIAMAHASAPVQAPLRAMLALDVRLARIPALVDEPILAQMRLAWWRDQLSAPVKQRPRGDVLLDMLGSTWRGEEPALMDLIDGWESLIVPDELNRTALEAFSSGYGIAWAGYARICSEDDATANADRAGRLYALGTLSGHLSSASERQVVMDYAIGRLPDRPVLPRKLRPLTILSGLARRALRRGGGPLLGDRLSPLVAMRLGIFGR